MHCACRANGCAGLCTVLAGLMVVLDYALSWTKGSENSRSRVHVQIGEELVNSSTCACN
jgi:hypothetical protein